MSMHALQQFISTRTGIRTDARDIVLNWNLQVQALGTIVQDAFSEMREKNLVQIGGRFIDADEPELGRYQTEQLVIKFKSVAGEVLMTPRSPLSNSLRPVDGSVVRGVKGRVELSYGAKSIPMGRLDDQWLMAFGGAVHPLSAESLERAILYLVG